MDGVFEALLPAAAADVTGHRLANLVVAGFGILREQGGGLHDLAGLAVSALRDIDLPPGFLQRGSAVWVEPFDGGNFAIGRVGYRGDAGAYGLLVDHHGTRTAQCLTATEFGAGQSDFIADKPE